MTAATNNDKQQNLWQDHIKLGKLCFDRGDYKTAEQKLRKALSIVEGMNWRDERLSMTLLNLATVLCIQEKHDEADPIYKKLLTLDQSLLGEQSTDFAMDLNNVAAHCRRMERYSESEQFYSRALRILENHGVTETNPDYALTLHNLAVLYCVQGLCTKAEPIFRKALAMRECIFGSKHQYVAETMLNLAVLLGQNHRQPEADELFQRGIAIFEFTLGPDHPELGQALRDYAEMLLSQGRADEATALEERANAIDKRRSGQWHC